MGMQFAPVHLYERQMDYYCLGFGQIGHGRRTVGYQHVTAEDFREGGCAILFFLSFELFYSNPS
jgi:hypothetical protein